RSPMRRGRRRACSRGCSDGGEHEAGCAQSLEPRRLFARSQRKNSRGGAESGGWWADPERFGRQEPKQAKRSLRPYGRPIEHGTEKVFSLTAPPPLRVLRGRSGTRYALMATGAIWNMQIPVRERS